MINCPELKESFETKEDLFKALKENEKSIIELKRSKIIETKDNLVTMNQVKSEGVSKAFNLNEDDVCAIINTTMYRDSHKDVHGNDLWEKSIRDQYGRIFYVCDHSLDLDKIIVWRDDLVMFTQMIDWSLVGKNYSGQTQALVFKFDKKKVRNSHALDVINEKKDVQNSIRMQYVTVKLAVNSNDEEYKENKATWDKYINSIANKEECYEDDYFWYISEAKIISEGSMLVFGSNDATSVVTSTKEIEPSADTQEKKNDEAVSSHVDTSELEKRRLLITKFKDDV